MGYRTVMRVPRFVDYKAAFDKWNNTKPILGRTPEIRPLGDRRDCDTFSIRKNVWTQAIECVLYQTPVIKFTVEDEVIINFGRWPSASTCQFISRVLHGVSACRLRKQVVLSFVGGANVMVAEEEELVLVKVEGRWQPKVKQTLYDWRINRAGANNVRKTVSMFKDYMMGVVKLKGEYIEGYNPTYKSVPFTFEELFAVFGERDLWGNAETMVPHIEQWYVIGIKTHAQYREKAEQVYELIKNDQDDNTRYQNYWIAFCILALYDKVFYGNNVKTQTIWRDANEFEFRLDKFLLTLFSDQAFKRVALPEGKVPTGKYDKFIGEAA